MQHKFPFVSLHIRMTGNDLDVNVHPRKMEVRFAREAEVYEAVYEAVRRVLTKREMIPNVPVGKEEPKRQENSMTKPGSVPEPFEVKRREQMYPSAAPNSLKENSLKETSLYSSAAPFTREEEHLFDGTLRKNTPEEIPQDHSNHQVTPPEQIKERTEKVQSVSEQPVQDSPKQLELFEEKLLSPQSRNRHKLIGQLFDTYWLVEFDNNFYIIDQHAAHEKVYYERFVKQFKERTVVSQYLSPSLVVTLNLEEEELLKANNDYFREFGFEIEHFGGKEYCISAVPSDLYGMTEESLFLDMLDHLAGEGEKDALELFTSRLATMACKAAVKGNHRMSTLEADKLIDELLKLENPYHCPHGRPTIVSMTKTEIEKKFKRIV
jgi:DNA mismatch repair protein MutL